MKTKRLLILIGSICLSLVLAALLIPACAPAAPPEVAEEVAELEDKLAAEKAKVKDLEGDVGDLEDEIAALKKPAEVYEWRFQHYWGAGEHWLFEPFHEQVEELSDGRILVDMYSDGGLVPMTEVFEALRTGVLDISFNEGSFWAHVIPVAEIEFMSSLISRDVRHGWVLFDEGIDYEGKPFGFGLTKILREQYLEKQDIYFISPHFSDTCLFFLKEPITTFDDFRGRRIWTTPLITRILEPTGIVTAVIPPEELYTSLAAGIIDGVVWGSEACGWDMGWHEVTSYIVRPVIQDVQTNFTMAPEKWYALPDDLKAIVEAAIVYDSNFMKTAYTYRDIYKQRVMVEEYGLEVIQLPPEEMDRYSRWQVDVLDELMQVDEASREAGEIVKDWMRFFGYID